MFEMTVKRSVGLEVVNRIIDPWEARSFVCFEHPTYSLILVQKSADPKVNPYKYVCAKQTNRQLWSISTLSDHQIHLVRADHPVHLSVLLPNRGPGRHVLADPGGHQHHRRLPRLAGLPCHRCLQQQPTPAELAYGRIGAGKTPAQSPAERIPEKAQRVGCVRQGKVVDGQQWIAGESIGNSSEIWRGLR